MKKKKDIRPGIRVPTAKGSIRHKSKKDYNRKEFHEAVTEVLKRHHGLFKRLKESGD